MRWPVACATAHRKLEDRGQWPWVRAELRRVAAKLAAEHGTTLAWSGMALGGDLEWAEAIVRTDGLQLGACVPFRGQADRWPQREKYRWQTLVDEASEIRVVGDLKGVPTGKRSARANQLYHGRNNLMLSMSQVLVAVLDLDRANDNSGTYTTFVAARDNLKLPIIHIKPNGDTTRMLNASVAAACT